MTATYLSPCLGRFLFWSKVADRTQTGSLQKRDLRKNHAKVEIQCTRDSFHGHWCGSWGNFLLHFSV